MKYRELADSGVRVSEVGFGVWTVAAGWWGEHSDDEAAALLRHAMDLGVTFFDTAETYGNGRGETVLAHAFPGVERDRIVIGAKFGYDWANRDPNQAGHREAPHRFDVPFLEQALDASLKRLGTDRIDFYQLHNPRMAHLQLDDIWTWAERAKAAGKVRAIGVALGPAIGWLEEGLYAMEHLPVEGVQMIYNALELDPGRELIACAERTGKSLVVRVPHSSGMLEGNYTTETTFGPNDHRQHRPKAWLEDGLRKIESLDFLSAETGSTLGQAALRYALQSPTVVSALPNIYEVSQLVEFAAAGDQPALSEAQVARVIDLYETNYGLPRRAAEAAVAR
ncbi:MAG: aldo/keto reductase [Dehalococcoidia bacterium]|nr:aldo/keto reductase [Dehalococcoidia bacterium]